MQSAHGLRAGHSVSTPLTSPSGSQSAVLMSAYVLDSSRSLKNAKERQQGCRPQEARDLVEESDFPHMDRNEGGSPSIPPGGQSPTLGHAQLFYLVFVSPLTEILTALYCHRTKCMSYV